MSSRSGSDSDSNRSISPINDAPVPTPGHGLTRSMSNSPEFTEERRSLNKTPNRSPSRSRSRSSSRSRSGSRKSRSRSGSVKSRSRSGSRKSRSRSGSHKTRSRSGSRSGSHKSRSRSGSRNSRSRSGSVKSRSRSGSRKSRSRSGSFKSRSQSGSRKSRSHSPSRSGSRSGSNHSRSRSPSNKSGSRSRSGSPNLQIDEPSTPKDDNKTKPESKNSSSDDEMNGSNKKKNQVIASDSEEDGGDGGEKKEEVSAAAIFGDDADDISSEDEKDKDDDKIVNDSDKEETTAQKSDDDEQDGRRSSRFSDNEENKPEAVPETRIDVEIPKISCDLGKDIHFVKLPNFLSVETRPFDPETYEDEIDEEETLDEEGRARLKLKVENTIRWRDVLDKEGTLKKESNARLVRWSDGSYSLHLGSEIFDVYKQPLQGDHNHLFIRQGTGLQGQAVFRTKLSFRPHSTESFTHRKMTLSLADRSQKTSGIKILSQVGADPDHDRKFLLKKEEEKLRQTVRVSKPRRKGDSGTRLHNSLYREEEGSEDEGAISLNAIKNKYKSGAAALAKGGAIYSSDEEGSDIENRRARKLDKAKALKDSDSSEDSD